MTSRKSLGQVLFQEIIDNIIDYLEDDRKSLLSCAQTCRELLPRAQSYIFRSVSLASPQLDQLRKWDKYGNSSIVPKSRVESLYDIVQARPGLPCNIRVLTLEVTADDCGAWLSEDINFLHIVSLLAHSTELFPAISILGDTTEDEFVCCFSIADEDHPIPNVRFPYHPEFRPRFWTPLIAPFITKLDLLDLEEVPIGILLTCPKLRSLRIEVVSINAEETFGIQGCQPRLETLEFCECSEAVDKIFGLSNSDRPHLDPSLLRSLDVSPKKTNPIDCLPRLMRAVRRSLENLVVDDIDCHPQLSIFFHLSKLPALRTIHVKCALPYIRYVHPFDGLSELLSSSGQSTMLEKIEVVTTIDPGLSPFGSEWWEPDHPGWAQFDTALDHLTSLSGFRKLSVLIHFVRLDRNGGGQHNLHWGQEWEAEVISLYRDRLPLAHRNPGVCFVCSFDVAK